MGEEFLKKLYTICALISLFCALICMDEMIAGFRSGSPLHGFGYLLLTIYSVILFYFAMKE